MLSWINNLIETTDDPQELRQLLFYKDKLEQAVEIYRNGKLIGRMRYMDALSIHPKGYWENGCWNVVD